MAISSLVVEARAMNLACRRETRYIFTMSNVLHRCSISRDPRISGGNDVGIPPHGVGPITPVEGNNTGEKLDIGGQCIESGIDITRRSPRRCRRGELKFCLPGSRRCARRFARLLQRFAHVEVLINSTSYVTPGTKSAFLWRHLPLLRALQLISLQRRE